MGCFHSMCCSMCRRRTRKKIIVLLVGLDNAGKTTALKGLAGESIDKVIPTIGFSSTMLRYKQYDVQVYDLGGGKNIRGIWSKYFSNVHGVIFVVDASAVERLEECRQELKQLLESDKLAGKPLLVLANKQDLPGALDEVDLVDQLGLEALVNKHKSPTTVETCAAIFTQDPAIQIGYNWLLKTIDKQFSHLQKRVALDVKEQEDHEEKVLAERRQRVARLREERLATQTAANGHAEQIEVEDQDFNTDPFRPISELTGGSKIILVQESPKQQQQQVTSSIESTKSVQENKPKKKSAFSLRNNKTSPMVDGTSPKRKAVLPPLGPSALNTESVPWIKPVLSASSVEGRTSHHDGAWGLADDLEPVACEVSTIQLTSLGRPTIDNGF